MQKDKISLLAKLNLDKLGFKEKKIIFILPFLAKLL